MLCNADDAMIRILVTVTSGMLHKCPYDSDDEDAKERKKQKKKQEKKEGSNKKKGDAHVTTWDSDDSSSDDESTKKKAHASIAIQGKSSIFNTPLCFMAVDGP